MQLPANWYWPLLGLAILVAGVVWGWGGLSSEEETPEGPAGGLKAAQGRGGGGVQGGGGAQGSSQAQGGGGQGFSGQEAGAGGRQQAGGGKQSNSGGQVPR